MPFVAAALLCWVAGCDPSQGGGSVQQSQIQSEEVPQQASAPVQDSKLTRRNYYVVFDGSGSMQESKCAGNSRKIDVAKQAVKEFARNLKPEDNLGLLVFDSNGISERVALSNGDRAMFDQAIDNIYANSGTPLYQSMGIAFESLKVQMARQLNYGEYHLVVVTDGEANDGDNGLIEQINRSPVIIHTIGFCIGSGHSLNQPGKTHYADAQSPEAVKKGLQDVLAESDTFSK